MANFAEVNFWAVLAATAATMFLGFLWYSPVLFGKKWAELRGVKMEEMSGGGAMTYVWTALTALIGSYVLALLLTLSSESSVTSGMCVGMLVGVSIAVKIGMNYLFENQKLALYFITIGYHLVSYVVAGAIIGAM